MASTSDRSSSIATVSQQPPSKHQVTTTEALVAQLLDPRVSDYETNEYHRYVNQFSSGSSLLLKASGDNAFDEKFYQNYIAESKQGHLPDSYAVKPKDLLLYQKTVVAGINLLSLLPR